MKYIRKHLSLLKDRINEPRRFIQAIIGPRQVGKTTLIKQLVSEVNMPHLYVTADNIASDSAFWIEQQWETARIKQKTIPETSFLLIIDEIQKITNWSETVKMLWDNDSFNQINIKVILLGSSGLMLQQGLSESLAGRYELIRVEHWSFAEMRDCFGITAEQYAWFGGYPGATELIKNEMRWKDYVQNALIEATISKDILMLTRVDKPALMRQVFEMGVNYSSKILSYNKLVGQLQDAGNTTTIAHYLQLLDTAGLLKGIPKLYSEQYRTRASTPKWQIKNTALFAALSSLQFDKVRINLTQWGQVVESAIAAHLINYADQGNYQVYYWRHRNDEVDFILKRGDELIALEVKSGMAKSTQGMKTFKEKFKPKKMLLIGGTEIPWEEFLLMEPADLF